MYIILVNAEQNNNYMYNRDKLLARMTSVVLFLEFLEFHVF